MSSLETTIAELRRVQADLATSQAQFIEEVYTPPQEELNVNNGVDELAFTMAKLAKCGVDLSINEEMNPMPLLILNQNLRYINLYKRRE